MTKLLLVDNHDSFTWNIVEVLRQIGHVSLTVKKSGSFDAESAGVYDLIIFSPGPGLPSDQPEMAEILAAWQHNRRILGICLGHQAIASHYGGSLFNLSGIVHGCEKKLFIEDDMEVLFSGIKQGTAVGLYHSWAVDECSLPHELKVTARSEDGIIMGLRHCSFDVSGVQFHPESFITTKGTRMLKNWITGKR